MKRRSEAASHGSNPEKKHCPEPDPKATETELDPEATETEPETEPETESDSKNESPVQDKDPSDVPGLQSLVETVSSSLESGTDAKCQEQKAPPQLPAGELFQMNQPALRQLYVAKGGLPTKAKKMTISSLILAIAERSTYPSDVMERVQTFCNNYTHKGPELYKFCQKHGCATKGFHPRTDKHVLALALTDRNIRLEPIEGKKKKTHEPIPRWLNKKTIDSLSIEHLALLKSFLEDIS